MPDPTPARRALAEYEALLRSANELEAMSSGLAGVVRTAVGGIRRSKAMEQVSGIPVSKLRETAKGLRLDSLERAGYRRLGHVLTSSERQLQAVQGIGEATARQVIAAARQVLVASEGAVRLHLDVVTREADQTELLVQLRRYDAARRAADESEAMIGWLRTTVAAAAVAARPAGDSWLRRTFRRSSTKVEAASATEHLLRLLAEPALVGFRAFLAATAEEVNRPRSPDEAWSDYENNASQLLGVLGEIVEGHDAPANRGHLPTEIVDRVQAMKLDLTFMKASLRGYQAFGAKYALVQQRTILGDEMGLGKTVEALAAICHVAANNSRHALVVCPASVVANWRLEIHKHTELRAHVLHGADRDQSERSWRRVGGVAITTFDGLRRLHRNGDEADPPPTIGMLVVDEAHYVKNPTTLRSQAVASWAADTDRVLFLTGTPMENRVEEFRALIDHLQPDLALGVTATTALAGPAAFQTAVAPAYLRRNQTDVLDELPELIKSLDWVDPTPHDLQSYKAAVRAQAFQTMRRAAYTSIHAGGPSSIAEADRSAKAARLADIIEEASQEGLKVVVFSYFRDVLDIVTRAVQLVLPDAVYGPLTGRTAPSERQRLVESLGSHPGAAVLTAQIEAGGVGLNIQAASVVVLCEPQWKPTVEHQAIARCHRMGQVRRVMVHRLLLEDTVDQRMLTVLAGKQRLIEQFVQGSIVKDLAPDAIDISDLERVDQVVNEAQAEALIIASERRRLGLDGSQPQLG